MALTVLNLLTVFNLLKILFLNEKQDTGVIIVKQMIEVKILNLACMQPLLQSFVKKAGINSNSLIFSSRKLIPKIHISQGFQRDDFI